ncbi:hypothetical protein NitYY0826_C2011 [Nitratiruptor sp. YY08-26]|uniref:thioredoxin family protein n=1 Tax=unclassified Nitratiruptor TaxID=2624044 RepID=UPI001915E3A6|nr:MULTISPECIES: thioredoxin family protein [unclassified Nitratiruptor]BCD63121.1 hypothetical protein NitYY0813_C2009 [Nitratiruptor sp. YY08-13]BCD67056.1 hypothetical protein NitYY0826_C2011 [Nitratiruptor sp. YY08-26]
MKKIFLLIPLIMFGIDYHSYKDAVKKAKELHKPVMIEITSSHCHYCKWMESTTLQDKEVVSFIQKNFIPVRIDVSKEEIPKGIEYSMTPTFIFMDPKGRIIKKIPGAWKKEDFLKILKEVKE